MRSRLDAGPGGGESGTMELEDLNPDERIALVGLVREVVLADSQISEDEIDEVAEIVACFDALIHTEILWHNWGTCGRDCTADWNVTDETYINGVMMTLDFDFIMGYLVQAVDRTSGQCTYVAIVQYHGRRDDGTFEHDFVSWPGTHTFFDKEDGFDQADVCRWAVGAIYSMLETRQQRR